MNKYRQSYKPDNSEVYGRRRRGGCGWVFLVTAIIATSLIGLFLWNTMTAAHADTPPASPQEAEGRLEDVTNICGLESVVCDGEKAATPKQEAWIDKLEQCESSGNPNAINPKDVDGTPSYGAFQFKTGTFKMYLKRYEMKGDLMDREVQREIVVTMLADQKVRWMTEFPNCVRKLGVPPKN